MISIKVFRKFQFEIFDFCNRKCNWCINKDLNRNNHEHINYLSDEHIDIGIEFIKKNKRFIDDEIIISFSRYNEALFDSQYINNVGWHIREKLNEDNIKYKLVVHTNGDFLYGHSKTFLSCLDIVYINDYDNHGIKYFDIILNRMLLTKKDVIVDFSKIRNTIPKIIFYVKGVNTRYEILLNTMKYMYRKTRGGKISVDGHKCLSGYDDENDECITNTYIELSIDYTGAVMPCCETCFEVKEHKELVLCATDDLLSLDIEKINTIRKNHKACLLCNYKHDGGKVWS